MFDRFDCSVFLLFKSAFFFPHFGKDVYRGVWLQTDVALKKIKDPQLITQLKDEAELLKVLNYPHVVKYLGL